MTTTNKINDNPSVQKEETSSKKFMKGVLLYALVLSGYMLFCFNWMIMDNMKGVGEGWQGAFFAGSGTISSTIDQSVNWTITFMRGVGAFLAGWLLVKVGHKYAVIIALSLLSLGVIAPWAAGVNYDGGEDRPGLFSLFIILRMAMAVGGTTLIVYTQPIIATYFNEEQKTSASLINSVGFNTGSIIAILPLAFTGAHDVILDNWQWFTSGVAMIAVILLVVYVFVGEDIATPDDPNDTATYGSVMKEKRTIMYSIMYIFWLTVAVIVLTMVPSYFINEINGSEFASVATGDATPLDTYFSGWVSVYKVLYLAGLFLGIPIFNWVKKTNCPRRPLIMSVITAGVVFMIVASIIGAYGVADDSASSKAALAFMDIFIFMSGVCIWGIQGIILGAPYDYEGATPKKQGIMLGSIWGIGYMGETVVTIFLTLVNGAGGHELGDYAVSNAWVFLVLLSVLSLMTAVMWIWIPETHGKNKSEISTVGKKATA